MICGEDDTMCAHRCTHLVEHINAFDLSGAEMLCLATVNVSRNKVRTNNTREGEELIAKYRERVAGILFREGAFLKVKRKFNT